MESERDMMRSSRHQLAVSDNSKISSSTMPTSSQPASQQQQQQPIQLYAVTKVYQENVMYSQITIDPPPEVHLHVRIG